MGEHPFTLQAKGSGDGSGAQLALTTPDMGQGMGADSLNHAHTMVTVQQMRHNEGLVTALVELAMTSRERDGEIIAKLQRDNDKMRDRQLDVIEMLEGMMTRKQEREIAHATYEEDKQRKDQVLAKITGFILPAMAKESGIKLPEDVAETVRQIFLRLSDDTQNQITKDLPEVDREKLLELMENSEETKH